MPLLLLPLVVLGLLLLWAVLLPVLLLQRYRMGRARQRAIGWVVSTNAWALLVSVVGFIGGAWISGHWVPQALSYAAVGLLVGVLLGLVGLWSSRFEPGSQRYHYTPNRWLILLLTLLVAGRLLIFFPGSYENNNYRLLDAYDGWNYLAVPITADKD